MAIIRYKRIENGASRCFDKQSKRLIPLNYRGRNQRHKRLFPAVCCLSESWAFQFLLAERWFQREKERERWTEQRERTVDRRSERRKCGGIRAWLERAGESKAFPSKLWNLFLEETQQRTRGKPGGYLSKRLRNNCSAIRMRSLPFHPIRFPLSIFLRFYSYEISWESPLQIFCASFAQVKCIIFSNHEFFFRASSLHSIR